MNLYFLVEGLRTEEKVYPAWLSYLIPELDQVDNFEAVEHNNYYLFNCNGIPSIYDDIIDTIETVNEIEKYEYLVVCLDAEELSVQERIAEVNALLEETGIKLSSSIQLELIIQNRCVETWFLGNRKVYTRNPQYDSDFINYSRFYDVSQQDPEEMPIYRDPSGKTRYKTIAQFHSAYLRAMFRERNLSYSKANPRVVQDLAYLKELQNRVTGTPFHLKTLKNFLSFCDRIRYEIILDK